jgi:hypothetical protein
MKRLIAFFSLLSVGFLGWVAPGSPMDQQSTQAKPVLPPGGSGAATYLQVNARCSQTNPGMRVAKFSWQVAAEPGEAQRLDLTMFRGGFERGQFETIARLSATQSAADSDKGDPGINYYWRVLTLTPAGWVPSDTARYEAPICPVDTIEEGPAKPD